jgi:preprotein translocase subunit SecY
MIGRPEKPRWQSSVLSVGTTILAALSAAGFALLIWRRFIWRQLSPTFGFAMLVLIFVVLAGAFYVLWMWLFFEHPAEIAKKLPISSSELRRKQKEFFDNLPK